MSDQLLVRVPTPTHTAVDGDVPPAPPLPPPPPVERLRSWTIAAAGLDQRLRALREQHQQRADFAAAASATAAVILLLYNVAVLVILARWFPWASAGAGWAALIAVVCAALAALSAGLVFAIATIRSVFAYHYRLAWQRMLHGCQAALFADEERQRLLFTALPSRWWTGSAKLAPRNLEERLEFCAYHIDSLTALLDQPEHVPVRLAALEQLAHGQAWLFRNPGVFWAAAVAAIVFAVLVLPLLGLGLYPLLGGRTIAASAHLTAFLDLYLGEPRLDTAILSPPDEPRGWWRRTLAVWAEHN